MKDFKNFKSYVSEHGEEIHSSIHQKVLDAANKQNFNSPGEEHEFLRRTWSEFSVMVMLEHYHNWLNS